MNDEISRGKISKGSFAPLDRLTMQVGIVLTAIAGQSSEDNGWVAFNDIHKWVESYEKEPIPKAELLAILNNIYWNYGILVMEERLDIPDSQFRYALIWELKSSEYKSPYPFETS